jgi:hypothetical protein
MKRNGMGRGVTRIIEYDYEYGKERIVDLARISGAIGLNIYESAYFVGSV